MSSIVLKDPDDYETYQKVKAILARLQSDPLSGIGEILSPKEYPEAGLVTKGTIFLVNAKKGYTIVEAPIKGPITSTNIKYKGMHGYLPDSLEMQSIFLISGPGIPSNLNLGQIRLIDIAPTLAPKLGIDNKYLFKGKDVFRQIYQ